MTTHDPVPIGSDGEEPLSGLFNDMSNLADQVAKRIRQDEVEDRLRRVLRRARQCGPVGGDSIRLTRPFDAADVILRSQPQGELLEAQLHEVRQAIAGARKELAAVGAEARRTLDLALAAYAEAEKARADATKVVGEAKAYHDAALESAAAIVKDARAAAESIKQAALEAKACHAAALESAAAIVNEAKISVESIKQAAREVAYQRDGDCAENQGAISGDVVLVGVDGRAAREVAYQRDGDCAEILGAISGGVVLVGVGGMGHISHAVQHLPPAATSPTWVLNAASSESNADESPPSSDLTRNWYQRLRCKLFQHAYLGPHDLAYWAAGYWSLWQPDYGDLPERDDGVVFTVFMKGGSERANGDVRSDTPGEGVLSVLAACGALAMPVVETYGGWPVMSALSDSGELANGC